MVLTISTQSGDQVKHWTWTDAKNYKGWWWKKYTCSLARGTYLISVTGTDLAGNAQSRVGSAALTVE